MALHRVVLVGAVVVGSLAAQNLGDYFVNGLTGTDVPGNGGSAAMPWKTITYAITQIPPVDPGTQSANWRTLYVEGNQTYAPSTNGETLPIRPAYNLWIEGTFIGHGVQPVIRPPAGGVGLAYDPAIVYSRTPSTLRYVVFDGGAYGITLGASGNQRHRPRIQDCTFRGQTNAGARAVGAGSSRGIDPRFFQCAFSGGHTGIELVSNSAGAVVAADVEECTFSDLQGPGIRADNVLGAGNVGGVFRSNWFRRCFYGVYVNANPGAAGTTVEVYSCSFADQTAEAIFVALSRSGANNFIIDQCSFLRSPYGVRIDAALEPASNTFRIADCVASACGTGFDLRFRGAGACAFDSSNNLAEGCFVGTSVTGLDAGLALTHRSLGDRWLRNDTGLSLLSSQTTNSFAVQSAMICGNRVTGLALAAQAAVLAHSLTLADNGRALDASTAGAVLDHCVFAANTTDVTGTPAITYSCFDRITYPGTGNLNNTAPQLVRPFYKLAPTSPCLDAGNPAATLPLTDYEGDPRASVSRLGGSALPDLGADEYVLAGSARKYGLRGFGLYNFFPQINAASPNAPIGSALRVELSGAILPVFGVPARDAFLTLGLRDDAGGLPFDLSVLGAPGSLLWNDINLVIGLFPVTPVGTASVPIPIPNAQLLIGLNLTFQWFASLRSANPNAPVASDGLRVTVGQ